MVFAIWILTLTQVYLELRICSRIPFMHSWNRKSPLFGLALSVVLSALSAMAFGATGMIVLVSGLLSTMITQVYYSLPEDFYNNIHKRRKDIDNWYVKSRDQWYINFILVMKVVKLVLAIVMVIPNILLTIFRFVDNRSAARREAASNTLS